jgi:WD40 repeat protein
LVGLEHTGTLFVWRLHHRGVELAARIATGVSPSWDIAIDRDLIAIAGRDGLHLHRRNGEPVRSLARRGFTQCVSFAPDGQRIFCAGDDGKLAIYARSGELLDELPAGERNAGIAFHPDGRRYAVSASWAGGSKVADFEIATDTISGAAYSPDGRYLAVPARELLAFELASSCLVVAFDHHGRVVTPARELHLSERWTRAVFTPSGLLVAATPIDGSISFFDLDQRACVRTLKGHTEGTFALDVSPDGRTLASTGYDATVRLWRL